MKKRGVVLALVVFALLSLFSLSTLAQVSDPDSCAEVGVVGVLDVDVSSCEGLSSPSCFLDRSATNTQKCYDCRPDLNQNCYDYKSQDTCERDPCSVGNSSFPCEWSDTFSELGLGVCKQKDSFNCLFCDLAGTPGVESSEAHNPTLDSCSEAREAALSTGTFTCESINGTKCYDKNINILEPATLAGNSSPVTVVIGVKNGSVDMACGISQLDQDFSAMPRMTRTGTFTHELAVSISGPSQKLFIACSDGAKRSPVIAVDTTAPKITSAFADPALIVDLPFQTTLKVETDEDTLCKFDVDANSSDGFDGYRFFFGESEQCPGEGYAKTHNKLFNDPAFIEDNVSLNINVICRNRVGKDSPSKSFPVRIDSNAPGGITIVEPPEFIGNRSPTFRVNTTRNAGCELFNGTDVFPMSGSGSREHTFSPSSLLAIGKHEYIANCSFTAGKAIKEFEFVIDTSKPIMRNVSSLNSKLNDTAFTFEKDELPLLWRAEEKESKIEEMQWVLWESNSSSTSTSIAEIIDNGTSSSAPSQSSEGEGLFGSNKRIRDLDLQNDTYYFFELTTTNPVGLKSSAKKGNSIFVNTSLLPASCTNGEQDGSESDVDCGGSCPSCDTGQSCSEDDDCVTDFCDNTTGICKGETCSDGIKNQDETDVDCGGNTCSKCANNKVCLASSDCTSGSCDSGKCTQINTCANGVKDANEPAVDCGVVCSNKCPEGSACNSASDCTTRFCHPSTSSCVKPTCSDGFKNQDESDVDCGGVCGTCAEGAACNFASDCASGLDCIGGRCAEPQQPDVIDIDDDEGGLGWFWWILIVLAVLALLGVGGYYAYQAYEDDNKKKQQKTKPVTPAQPFRPAMSRTLRPTGPSLVDKRSNVMNRRQNLLAKKKAALAPMKDRSSVASAFDAPKKPGTSSKPGANKVALKSASTQKPVSRPAPPIRKVAAAKPVQRKAAPSNRPAPKEESSGLEDALSGLKDVATYKKNKKRGRKKKS